MSHFFCEVLVAFFSWSWISERSRSVIPEANGISMGGRDVTGETRKTASGSFRILG